MESWLVDVACSLELECGPMSRPLILQEKSGMSVLAGHFQAGLY